MTPLLPNPDYYVANLITMTSSEATRLWRRAIKESFDCTCVYCGETYDYNDLTIDHVHPRSRGGETISSQTAYRPVVRVIRVKEVNNGMNGC